MARVSEVNDQTAPERVGELYADIEAEFGFVPQLFRTMAHDEPLARISWKRLDAMMNGGRLDRELAEKIAVAVSAANDCDYCVGAHTMALVHAVGVDEDHVKAILEQRYAALPERDRAAVEFADAAARDATAVAESCYEALAEAFSEAEIVELTGVAMQFQGVNLFVDALEVEPEFGGMAYGGV